MNVDDVVAEKIAAAKVRIEAARARREGFAEARRSGLARRHAQKLNNLAAAEEKALSFENSQRQADAPEASVRATDGTVSVNPTETNDTEETG